MLNTASTKNLAVTNAIASIINSAFETGTNPAWFQVESLNRDGFLDAAFACGTPMNGKLSGGMETPSGKPARCDWKIRARMNADWVADDKEADSEWVVVDAYTALLNWKEYAKNTENSAYGRKVVSSYLQYLDAIGTGDYKLAEQIWSDSNWDGSSDDTMAQIAICEEVLYG